jgi:hypothetical protein
VIEPSLPCEYVRWVVEEAVADVVNDVHPVLEPLLDGGQYGPQERRKQRDILERMHLKIQEDKSSLPLFICAEGRNGAQGESVRDCGGDTMSVRE